MNEEELIDKTAEFLRIKNLSNLAGSVRTGVWKELSTFIIGKEEFDFQKKLHDKWKNFKFKTHVINRCNNMKHIKIKFSIYDWENLKKNHSNANTTSFLIAFDNCLRYFLQ